jgi:hypothetical protein
VRTRRVCTYAEVAIRMDYRRWAASVYKKRQKVCIGGGSRRRIRRGRKYV